MKLALCVLAATLAPVLAVAGQQPPALLAQAPLRELSLEDLGRIEVTTVSKQPAEIWRSPAAITVLTQDDIRRSGATTIAEVLRLVGGGQVSRLDSDHWAIGVRGFTSAFSKSLLVMIDGRSVYTPLFGGVYWQVQDTLLEDIERIEVIRGPGGTIWGSNAVNGVINIITRNSRQTTGLLAAVSGGNVDQGRAAFRYGATRGDALSYRAYGTAFVRDAQHHADGSGLDEWQMGRAGFRVDRTTPRGTLRVQGDAYGGRAGDQQAIASFFPPSRLVLEGQDRVSGGNLVGSWERPLTGGAGVRLQGYYDRTVRHANHFDETRDTVDVDFLHHLPFGPRNNVSWGAGARNSSARVAAKYDTLRLLPEDRSHRLASVFAQDEIALVRDALWVTVGSKFEHNSYTGWEVMPSARLLWRPDAQQTVWAAVTRALRTPSRIETDLEFSNFGLANPPAYVVVVGSPDFASETVLGTELGYRRLIGTQLYLDVAAFHNHYDDMAALGPLALTVQTAPIVHIEVKTPWVNGIRGDLNGFEVGPDWRPAPWLRLRGSYALLSIDLENRPGNADDLSLAAYEGSSPRHQGQVQASLTLPRQIEVDYIHRAVSRLPSRAIPAYQTADVRAGWTVGADVTLAVAGQNLFAPNHPEFFRDDAPPIGIRRSVVASLTWRR